MPYRWPEDTVWTRLAFHVEDRWCRTCGGRRTVCDHRHRHLCTLDGPLPVVCKLAYGSERGCPAHTRTLSPEAETARAMPLKSSYCWRRRGPGPSGEAHRCGGGGRRNTRPVCGGSRRSSPVFRTASAPITLCARSPSPSSRRTAAPRCPCGTRCGGGGRSHGRCSPHGDHLRHQRVPKPTARRPRPTRSRLPRTPRRWCGSSVRRCVASSTTLQGGLCLPPGSAWPKPWRTSTPPSSGIWRRNKGADARALRAVSGLYRPGSDGGPRRPRGAPRPWGGGPGGASDARSGQWRLCPASGAVSGLAGAVPNE